MTRTFQHLLTAGIIGLLLIAFTQCESPRTEPTNPPAAKDESTGYDSARAARLGADDYGMKAYVLAFLKRGPNRDRDSAEAAQLQRAHLDNITRMAKNGQLVVAGPFMDNGDIRGIYIFNVPTVEEAEALTNTDPAVQAGSLVMELHPWYGPAGLGEMLEISKAISKQPI